MGYVLLVLLYVCTHTMRRGSLRYKFCLFVFLSTNFNKFTEFKCYFVGNLVLVLDLILVLKLPLTTSVEVPVEILVMVEFFKKIFYPFLFSFSFFSLFFFLPMIK